MGPADRGAARRLIRRGTRRAARPRRAAPPRRRRSAARTGRARSRPSSWRHVPATAPSTRNVGNDCGVFDAEQLAAGAPRAARRCGGRGRAGRRPRSARKRGGAGVSRVGQQPVGHVEQLLAVLAREAAQLEPRQHPIERRQREAGEARDVLARRRPEARRGSGARGARPRRRGAAAAARSSPRRARRGRRGAAPTCPTAARARGRPTARRRARGPCRRSASSSLRSIVPAPSSRSPEPCAPRRPSPRAVGSPRRACSHDVRRASRMASANGQKSARETRWIVTRMSVAWTTLRSSSARVSAARSKPSQPRPQPDVHRRRVLRLDPADAPRARAAAGAARARAGAGGRAARG